MGGILIFFIDYTYVGYYVIEGLNWEEIFYDSLQITYILDAT